MPLQELAVQCQPASVEGLHLAEITASVWICGSSAREVLWRNAAIDNPCDSGCSRPPFARTRVVDPNRSR